MVLAIVAIAIGAALLGRPRAIVRGAAVIVWRLGGLVLDRGAQFEQKLRITAADLPGRCS